MAMECAEHGIAAWDAVGIDRGPVVALRRPCGAGWSSSADRPTARDPATCSPRGPGGWLNASARPRSALRFTSRAWRWSASSRVTQTNLALGYATAPIGPRYDICEHDWDYDTRVGWEHTLESSRTLGILDRIPMDYLGEDKVRNFKALATLWSAADALDLCIFAIAPTRALTLHDMAELLGAVTGWNTSAYEVMRLGERRLHLMRAYNLREV